MAQQGGREGAVFHGAVPPARITIPGSGNYPLIGRVDTFILRIGEIRFFMNSQAVPVWSAKHRRRAA
ncbi:hypothetical protein CFR79_09510 [Komagataeibacter saccharivorans]|nr:hypothetical protein CFR79_09510 [Komagataeibacter saccharivorans]